MESYHGQTCEIGDLGDASRLLGQNRRSPASSIVVPGIILDVFLSVRDSFWLQGMMCGMPGAFDCIKQFSETDFTSDLKKFDVPTLIVHGSDDQIVPINASAKAAVKLVKNATLLVYEGAPHGLPTTHKDKLNADLLAFLKS